MCFVSKSSENLCLSSFQEEASKLWHFLPKDSPVCKVICLWVMGSVNVSHWCVICHHVILIAFPFKLNISSEYDFIQNTSALFTRVHNQHWKERATKQVFLLIVNWSRSFKLDFNSKELCSSEHTGRGIKKPANRFQIPKAAADTIAATWGFGVRATVSIPHNVKISRVKYRKKMKRRNLAAIHSNWISAYSMVPKRTACANTYGNSTVTCK